MAGKSGLLLYNISMSENVLIAIIGLIGTIFAALIGLIVKVRQESIKSAMREQKQYDLFDHIFDILDDIKIRLDEHNHYAEKIGDIRLDISTIKKDIEYLRKG